MQALWCKMFFVSAQIGPDASQDISSTKWGDATSRVSLSSLLMVNHLLSLCLLGTMWGEEVASSAGTPSLLLPFAVDVPHSWVAQ